MRVPARFLITTGPISPTSVTSPRSTGARWSPLTSSPPAGPVSPSASQENEKEQVIPVPSGHTSPKLFAVFDRESSSWRTSRPSLPLESWPEQSPRWPHSGTWDLGAAYELLKQAPPTKGQDSSSLLPTPAARDWKSGRSNLIGTNARPLNEIMVMTLLPTPHANASTGAGTQGRAGGPNLQTVAALL